ncbi:MAG: hypothetical protein IJF27_04585 [Oscillospiraceae bacterium]|nr:hypothetical protein [Oscillospiraceae bacterium]MBQ9938064.1 hypothetical protein [Oscillospiraceae bacterium]
MAFDGNAAYDLSVFETHEREEQHRPELILIKRNRAVAKPSVAPIKIIAIMVGVLSVITLMIYNRVLLTELNDSIDDSKNELTILQSENVRLKAELENSMSLDSIESSIADIMNDMGMTRITQENVRYVVLSSEDATVSENQNDSAIKQWIDGVIEQIKAYKGE